jgi:DNA-binding transcriptional MocR family regulator
MKKNEWVYREILFRALERGERFFSQKSLASRCQTSIGNVHEALRPLEQMNCIEKKPMGFTVINPKKILLYWASTRNLERDVVYSTRADKGVNEIEKALPPVIFTAYSGYRFRFGSAPSDYSEVLVYGDRERIEERFPQSQGKPNLIVLKTDPHIETFKKAPVAQLFVDLWNLNTWYADEFVKALEKRIEKTIGG